jgi:4a-hydroxytetrahydrobiopterin dehydratase
MGSKWVREGEALKRSVECVDFETAIELVRVVALIAEEMDHHPDIDIRWRTVLFSLTTHSRGTVTELDVELAQRIDTVLTSRTVVEA